MKSGNACAGTASYCCYYHCFICCSAVGCASAFAIHPAATIPATAVTTTTATALLSLWMLVKIGFLYCTVLYCTVLYCDVLYLTFINVLKCYAVNLVCIDGASCRDIDSGGRVWSVVL